MSKATTGSKKVYSIGKYFHCVAELASKARCKLACERVLVDEYAKAAWAIGIAGAYRMLTDEARFLRA